MLILGIETSCDETAASVVRDGCDILSNVVASQDKLHVPYGGVVPEIACRAHLDSILPVMHRALQEAQVSLEQVDAVAVVHTPGLVGSLLIGITAAKTAAWLFNKPLIGVNHVHAHAYAAALGRTAPLFPCVSLVASGGHTTIFHSRTAIDHEPLGRTRDDAAGEAFDKAASVLGLPYPGGPAIDRAARNGNPRAIRFPRTRFEGSLDFSFSGVKTALLYHVKGYDLKNPLPSLAEPQIADVAASFQEAVVRTLADRLFDAAEQARADRIIVGGGVAANSRLRALLEEGAAKRGFELLLPPIRLCIDNAAMVAGLAWHLYNAGRIGDLAMDARPTTSSASAAKGK